MKNVTMLLLSFVVFGCTNTLAQSKNKFTVSGAVKDGNTGETLIGANVFLLTPKPSGTLTNAYGFFSIIAEEGTYKLVVSFSGYKTDTTEIELVKNMRMDVNIQSKKAQLDVVVISSKKKNENVSKPIMGVEKINMTQINKLPVIFGERDILKTIQLMPGFKAVGEGNAGFNVRGGNADQNLILLDEAPVYNASHLLGFFSTFNSDAIKDASIYKGGMPAQYGGRLSSVVDIKMKDGNAKKLDVAGGIGLIASRISIGAPIVKDKGSITVSARRTYADVFLGLQKDTGQGKRTLYFYDVNLKANYRVSKKDRVFLSGYFGKDFLKLSKDFSADWGNATATLRWNHVFGNRLFSNTSLIYSAYNYAVSIKIGDVIYKGKTNIIDYNFKQDFDWNITNDSKLRFGANFIRHSVDPGSVSTNNSAAGNVQPTQKRLSLESAIYASHEWKATDKIEIVYGVRASNLAVRGAGDFYEFSKSGVLTNTINYKKGETVKSYFNLEPRFSASFKLNDRNSIKASYNRNVQNLHLMTNSTSANPTDVWLPSTNNIKPEIADQVAVGFYKDSKDDVYEFTSEIYYKDLQNQIEYRNGAEILANNFVEGDLLYGKGRSYGIELMLRKKTGRLTGWVGYTLSKVEKQFNELNEGKYFNARQDRTHDISIVGMYDLSKKWNMSATWVYNTGSAITFPSGKYKVNNRTVFLYTERNGYRMPAYHRLDFAVNYEPSIHKTRRYKSSWSFGLYNVYGRENAFSIGFRENKDDPTKTEAVRTSLFRFIPSVTWNFKF
jgi:TonB dependent receptor/CarboxypepD_reg-like domain/TonB-dependent Receptor Plug Domain